MKLNSKHIKLKWKIFAFLIGFCALLLIILWLFQTVFLDAFYRRIKVSEVKKTASSVINNIDNKNLSDYISTISKSNDVYIEVMDTDKTSLYSSTDIKENAYQKMNDFEKNKLIEKAKSSNGEFYEYISVEPPKRPEMDNDFVGDFPKKQMRNTDSLVYVKIVKNSSGEDLIVFVNSVITPVNATVTTLRYQLYYVTAIMIILAIGLAIIIAKRVSKPIEEINKGAKELASGKYDTNFNGKGFLEIVELSKTLNTAAAELNKVESLRRELMANISHDLRTPLSLIYGYAEVMHDFPQEITPEQTQTIMDETQRLTMLVNDVFDISKLEAGIQQLNSTKFNLTNVIREITNRISELVKKDGYDITFNYNKDAEVTADEVKITQVIYNLIVNAINYTGEDKKITINQVISNEEVRIEVSDSGEGIEESYLPYIWDRYFKIDKTHKRAVTGTGLGLSIVKKVIELHNGKYGVESKCGKGSTFWFSLKI